MTGKRSPPWRDVLDIARFEILESMRTRRLLVLVLLFVIVGGVSAWIFARAVGLAESAIHAPSGGHPGASLDQLSHTMMYGDVISGAVGDPSMVEALSQVPPLALFFAWLAMRFVPLLLVLAAADVISSEIETRGLRYTLLRTGRAEYVAGKLVGQLAVVAGAIALCGIAFLAVSAVTMADFPLVGTALAMVRFWPWILLDALPYLALAIGASMLASTSQSGRAFAIVAALALAIVHGLARSEWIRRGAVPPMLLDGLDYLTPYPRGYGVLAPLGATFARSAALCLGLFAAYLGGAMAVFQKRDL